jgi:hypothetical protein
MAMKLARLAATLLALLSFWSLSRAGGPLPMRSAAPAAASTPAEQTHHQAARAHALASNAMTAPVPPSGALARRQPYQIPGPVGIARHRAPASQASPAP